MSSEDTKGAVSFKFRGLYYGFYNIGNVDFNTLGKQIASDLKNMTSENYELIKKLAINLKEPIDKRPNKNFNFTSITEVLTNPTMFYQLETEISETDGNSYPPYYLNYIYIIDLDKNQLVIKKYIFNKKDEYNLKTVKSEEIKTFDFEDIHDFWL